MKNIVSVIFFTLICCYAYSQINSNAIKFNVSGLIVRNLSVQYERQMSNKTSLAVAVRNVPYGKLPFPNTISSLVGDNPYIDFNKMKISSFGILPEARFYLGKKKTLLGFYLGVFANYTNYNTQLPVVYNNKTGLFNGKINTYTGGVQVGWQFKIVKDFFIDLWIVGPNYGASSGSLDFIGSLTPSEQSTLRTELEQIKNDVPYHFIKAIYVNDNGAYINAKGPWAGLRGLGINLSYHF